MINVVDIEYRYSSVVGGFKLGPVKMDLNSGVLNFLYGHNGSGKSTLAKILTKEISQNKGTIIGVNNAIYYHQRGSENVFFDLTVKDHFKIFVGEGLFDSTPYFQDIKNNFNKYPGELSGGQIQLLGFILTIYSNSDLLIFDEVTNNLDAETSAMVMEMIKIRLAEEAKLHCVIITHDKEIIEKYSDIVYVLSGGVISEIIEKNNNNRHLNLSIL